MLKIKDNVDLKELEKYGFYKDEFENYYFDFIEYTEWEYSYIKVDFNGYEMRFDWLDFEHYEKAIDLLFDLIKDGLVEKVRE